MTPPHTQEHEQTGVDDTDLLAAARRMVQERVGWTVRSIPHRTTLQHELPDGRSIFCKLRDRRPKDAHTEWHWLRQLPNLGFRAPKPILFTHNAHQNPNHTAVCTLQAPGRPLQTLIADAIETGQRAQIQTYLTSVVAPMLKRFHDARLVYRDLYWNHLYAESLHDLTTEPTFIDVERIFRPRFRWRRWQVKDLAGLVASFPPTATPSLLLRPFHTYLGAPDQRSPNQRAPKKTWHPLAKSILRKAARIRRHIPKYP